MFVFWPGKGNVQDGVDIFQPQGAAQWYTGAYAAYDPKNAISYAASLLDITGNGRHASTGIAPVWSASVGWDFGGTNYIITPVVPGMHWSMAVKFSATTTSGDRLICGSLRDIVGNLFYLAASFDGAVAASHIFANGSAAVVAGRLASGTMIISDTQGYLNGIANGSTVSGAYIGSDPIYIGRVLYNGALFGNFDGIITSWAVWNYGLSPSEVTTITAGMP